MLEQCFSQIISAKNAVSTTPWRREQDDSSMKTVELHYRCKCKELNDSGRNLLTIDKTNYFHTEILLPVNVERITCVHKLMWILHRPTLARAKCLNLATLYLNINFFCTSARVSFCQFLSKTHSSEQHNVHSVDIFYISILNVWTFFE